MQMKEWGGSEGGEGKKPKKKKEEETNVDCETVVTYQGCAALPLLPSQPSEEIKDC